MTQMAKCNPIPKNMNGRIGYSMTHHQVSCLHS